ncbi:hypothetical protein DFH09DRAFT_355540 [Mycena vulgaris]|nr:hypothetical protein DFH09DRAFT_355540 [Mycena vulgaris]
MRQRGLVSDSDQSLCLNLAINFLSVAHGFDPEVVCATWELTGDLHLTDELLRRTVVFLESKQRDDSVDHDEEIVELLALDRQRSSMKSESGDESQTTSSRKLAKSPDCVDESSPTPIPAPPPQQPVHGPGRASQMEGVPSSFPEEVGLPLSPQRHVHPNPRSPARGKPDDTIVPETSSDESESECEPEVSAPQVQRKTPPAIGPNAQPSVDAADSESDESDESESDSDASVQHSPSKLLTAQVGVRREDSDSGDSDSESEPEMARSQAPRSTFEDSPSEDSDSSDSQSLAEEPYIPTQTSLFGTYSPAL